MRRYSSLCSICILGVVILTALIPASVLALGADGWQLADYAFTPAAHSYRFEKVFALEEESKDGAGCIIITTYYWKAEAECRFEKQSGNFREFLTITPQSIRTESPYDGTWCHSYIYWTVPSEVGESATKWRYTTTGTTFSGMTGDPWLSHYPGKPLPASTTTENHTGVSRSYWKKLRSVPHPWSIFAMEDYQLRSKLNKEAYDAPKRFCDKALKTGNKAAVGPIRIISPTLGQAFENGYVLFKFEIPCQFSFGYNKHAFLVTLEKCVSGCLKTGSAAINMGTADTGRNRRKVELWIPVQLPTLNDNKMMIHADSSISKFTSNAARYFKIPFEGEGQKFRFKVKAQLWTGEGYLTLPGPEQWRYFWVGKNLQRPDFIVSQIDMAELGSSRLEFRFFVKEVGNPSYATRTCYKPEIRVEWFRGDEPAGTRTLIVPVKPGGEAYTWFDITRPVSPTPFKFKVTVDPGNRIREINEDNNTKIASLFWRGYKPRLKSKIQVDMPLKTLEWRAGRQYVVRWKGTMIEPNRRVRVFLVPQSCCGSEKRVELSPPAGFSFDLGGRRVTLPITIISGYYKIYLEMVGVPTYTTTSATVIHVYGGLGGTAGILKLKNKKLPSHPPAAVTLPKKPGMRSGGKPSAVVRKLWLKNPRGMETWYIGKTYPIKWTSTGLSGRIRIILKDKAGKERTLNGMMGTNVSDGHFPWKIGSNIAPGSMYTIYLKTIDGKVTSKKSGGFNIRKKVRPKGATINLNK